MEPTEFVDEQTADMLSESGDVQRAHIVNMLYEKFYDAFVIKHAKEFESIQSRHEAAHYHSITLLSFVFPESNR